MKAIVQRVSRASVSVNGDIVAAIGSGLMVLVGFGKDDTEAVIAPMLDKIINLRIFSNKDGRFDHSLLSQGAELLLVPQFTLYADTSKGRRPEFFSAMSPDTATIFFDKLVTLANERLPAKVQSGVFKAEMQVSLVNEGPVTIPLSLEG